MGCYTCLDRVQACQHHAHQDFESIDSATAVLDESARTLLVTLRDVEQPTGAQNLDDNAQLALRVLQAHEAEKEGKAF